MINCAKEVSIFGHIRNNTFFGSLHVVFRKRVRRQSSNESVYDCARDGCV
jgi:hypothetical protein